MVTFGYNFKFCVPPSNQHYWFSLAWTTKLISKQQANSGRKRGKEEGLFTLLLLQGADVLDKQCMTQVKSTGQRTGRISWCQSYPGMISDKSNVPLHWRRSQKSHANDFVSKSRIQHTPQPVTCFPDSSSERVKKQTALKAGGSLGVEYFGGQKHQVPQKSYHEGANPILRNFKHPSITEEV